MGRGRTGWLASCLASASGTTFVDYPHEQAPRALQPSAKPHVSEYWKQRQEQRQQQEQEQQQQQQQQEQTFVIHSRKAALPYNSSRKGIAGWSLDELNSLFYSGESSNSLRKAGLTIHSFDATEDHHRLWEPCASGWCKPASRWWSASIVNAQQRHTFGTHGILLAPSRTRVLCSHWADAGTLEEGCDTSTPGPATEHKPYPRKKLRWMLKRSMRPGMPYNEVLIDTKRYVARLPGSIAAIVCANPDARMQTKASNSPSAILADTSGLTPTPTDGLPGPGGAESDFVLPMGGDIWGQVEAANAYVGLLDAYNLSESDVFLLHANENFERFSGEGAVLTDHSRGAREFVRTHPHEEYLKRWRATHHSLATHPELYHQLAGRAQRRELRDAKHKLERKWRRAERTLNLTSHNITAPGGVAITPTSGDHSVAAHPFSMIGKKAAVGGGGSASVGVASDGPSVRDGQKAWALRQVQEPPRSLLLARGALL